jgi:hypothetical protein
MAGLQCFDTAGNLTFELGDSLGKIVLTGFTNGAKTGSVYVPQWEPSANNRPWFTTVNTAGFNANVRQPGWRVQAPNLVWTMDFPQDPPGGANVKFICGIW